MCRKTSCSTCNKATWFGCGMHIPAVMDSVPAGDWCACTPQVEKDGKMYPPKGPMPN